MPIGSMAMSVSSAMEAIAKDVNSRHPLAGAPGLLAAAGANGADGLGEGRAILHVEHDADGRGHLILAAREAREEPRERLPLVADHHPLAAAEDTGPLAKHPLQLSESHIEFHIYGTTGHDIG